MKFVCFSVHTEPKTTSSHKGMFFGIQYLLHLLKNIFINYFNSVKTQTPYEIIVFDVINILTKRGMLNYDFRPLTSSILKREYPMGLQHVTGNADCWPDTSLLIEEHLTDCLLLRNSLHFVTYLNCLKRQEQKFDSCIIRNKAAVISEIFPCHLYLNKMRWWFHSQALSFWTCAGRTSRNPFVNGDFRVPCAAAK